MSFVQRLLAFLASFQAIDLGVSHGDPSSVASYVTLGASVAAWALHEWFVQPKAEAKHRNGIRRALTMPPKPGK